MDQREIKDVVLINIVQLSITINSVKSIILNIQELLPYNMTSKLILLVERIITKCENIINMCKDS